MKTKARTEWIDKGEIGKFIRNYGLEQYVNADDIAAWICGRLNGFETFPIDTWEIYEFTRYGRTFYIDILFDTYIDDQVFGEVKLYPDMYGSTPENEDGYSVLYRELDKGGQFKEEDAEDAPAKKTVYVLIHEDEENGNMNVSVFAKREDAVQSVLNDVRIRNEDYDALDGLIVRAKSSIDYNGYFDDDDQCWTISEQEVIE